jgi:O-antigen/teichoic acid export membrane protein
MTPRARAVLLTASTANLLHHLLFPVLAIRALGAGTASDALFLVFILPGVAIVLLASSVLNWATPKLVHRPDTASRRALAWSLLWLVCGAMLLLGLLLWLLATLFVPPGDGAFAQAAGILPIALAAMAGIAVMGVAQSLYTAEHAVPDSEARILLGNLVTVALWFAFPPQTLAACAGFFLLRILLAAALLLPRLGAPRLPDPADADLRAIVRESRWLLLSSTWTKSEPFVDRLLLGAVTSGMAGAGGGVVAAFHVAQQTVSVVALLMHRTVTAPLVPQLAGELRRHDTAAAQARVRAALLRMAQVAVPVWLLFVVAGERILAPLFAGDAALAARIFVALGGLLLATLYGQVVAQYYYCTGATRSLLWRSVNGYTLGLALKLLALWQFGVMGLVLAISASWLLQALILRAGVPALLATPPSLRT